MNTTMDDREGVGDNERDEEQAAAVQARLSSHDASYRPNSSSDRRSTLWELFSQSPLMLEISDTAIACIYANVDDFCAALGRANYECVMIDFSERLVAHLDSHAFKQCFDKIGEVLATTKSFYDLHVSVDEFGDGPGMTAATSLLKACQSSIYNFSLGARRSRQHDMTRSTTEAQTLLALIRESPTLTDVGFPLWCGGQYDMNEGLMSALWGMDNLEGVALSGMNTVGNDTDKVSTERVGTLSYILEILLQKKSLRKLGLSHVALSHETLHSIDSSLRSTTTSLSELSIRHCFLPANAETTIVNLVTDNASLESLDVDHDCKEEALSYSSLLDKLADALETSPSLRSLSLSTRSWPSIEEVADFVSRIKNSSVTSLSLWWHPRGCDPDKKASGLVVDAIKVNYNLNNFDPHLRLHPDHSSVVSSLLRLNKAGRGYMRDNPASRESAFRVVNAVKDDLTSVFLHLQENPLVCSMLQGPRQKERRGRKRKWDAFIRG